MGLKEQKLKEKQEAEKQRLAEAEKQKQQQADAKRRFAPHFLKLSFSCLVVSID